MSKIEIKQQFKGIRPTIDASLLPANEAQTANNCKLRSGALNPLSSDLPSRTVNQFSFTDGFGTWTLAGTTFKLNGAAVSQSAPAAPTVTATTALAQSDVTVAASGITVAATAPAGTPGTAVSGTPANQQTSFVLNGNRLTVIYTVQPIYLGLTTTNTTNPFTALTQSAAVTVGGTSLSTVGATKALGGGVGTLKLENIELSTATVSWKLPPGGTTYTAYVSGWTATFEFTINYSSDMAIERAATYRITNVETSGIETPASTQTPIVALMPNTYAVLSGMGTSKIKRIYRAAGSVQNADYYFVAEVAAGTATYTDLVADADLGDVMPRIENPPATMTQVVWLPGGFCAGFYGKDIYFSDPFMLYSWNSEYTLTSQKTIVGLAVAGNDLIVLTEPPTSPDTDAKNYIITGVAPEVMTMSELMVNQGCSAINSICKVGNVVGFAAPEGYILITGGTGKNITEPYYNRAQWGALTPTGMVAKEYDNQIVIYTGTTDGIILDYVNGTLTTFSSSGAGSYTWKSKVIGSDLPIELHVAKITGSAGTLTLQLWADGVSVYSGSVTANTDTALTRGMAAGKEWEFQISGTTAVDGITLIHRERINVTGPMRITQDQTEGSWRRLLFQFPDTGRFKVVRVQGSNYTGMTAAFYRDSTADSSNSITSDTDIRLTQQTDNDLWEVDLTASGEVYELMLVPRAVQVVTGPMAIPGGRESWKGMLFQFPESNYFKVGRLRGSDGVVTGTLNFYVDEAVTATKSVSVTTDADFRITGMSPAQLVEVEFIPTDQTIKVDQLLLIPRTVQTVTGPVVLNGTNRSSWRGNVFQFPETGTFKVLRVRGPAGSITATVNFYANEAVAATKTIDITSDTDVRITGLDANELFEVEVVATQAIDEVVLIPRQVQTVTGPVVLGKRASWKGMLFQFPESGYFKVGRVRGKAGVATGTLNFYVDEATVATKSVAVTTDADFRITGMTASQLVEVEFVPTDSTIETDEIMLIPRTVQQITGPVVMSAQNRATWRGNVFQFPETGTFKVLRVRGAAGSITATVNIYANEAVAVTKTIAITDDTDVRITGLAANELFEVEVVASQAIDEVMLVPRQVQTVTGPVVLGKRASWKGMLFQFPESGYFKVGRVRGKAGTVTGTLNFYVDEATVATKSVSVTTDADFRITGMSAAQLVEVEFVPTDATIEVDEVMLIPRTVQVVTGPMVISGTNRATWRGMVFQFPDTGTFKVLRVRGPEGSIAATVNFYADEAVVATKTVNITNDTDVRLTALTPNELWEVEVVATQAIDEVVLIPRKVTTVTGPVILSGDNRLSWKGMLFQFPETGTFKVIRVRGPAGSITATVNIYADEAVTATQTINITSDTDVRITGLNANELFEIEVVASQAIDEVMLIPRQVQTVTGPVVLGKRASWKGMLFQFPESGYFKVGRVRGKAGVATGTLNFYVDEATVATKSVSVTTDADFRITGMSAAQLVEVEFVPTDATIEVDELMLIPRTVQVVTGPMVISGTNRATWRGMVFQFPDTGTFKVIRVRGPEGSITATVNIYSNEAVAATKTVSVTSDTDIRLTALTPNELWEVEVVATQAIDEVVLIPRKVMTVTGPVVLSGDNRLSWKGMLFQFPDRGSFKVGRVRGRAGSVSATLNFYENEADAATSTINVANDTDFRMTGVNAVELVEAELVPTGEVDELVLIPRTVQQVNGPVVLSKQGRISWKGNLVQFPDTGTFKVVRARGRAGSVTATLNLYADEAADPTRTVSITSDTDIRLDLLTPNELWEIEVVPTGELDEVILIPREVQTVTGPVVLSSRNRLSWKGNVFYFPRRGFFKVARVRGAPGATLGTLNLRADESNTVTLATVMSNDTDVRLTETTPGDLWEVEMTGNGDLDEVVLWPQAVQETNSPVIHVLRSVNQTPATWLAQEYRYPEPVRMRSFQVKSRTYPVTLTIYCDGTQVTGSPYTVSSASEVRLTHPIAYGRVWEFDASADGIIDSVTLWAEQLIQPKQGVVHIKYDGVQGVVSTLAKVVRFPKEDYFATARVDASVYPVQLKFYRDGARDKTFERTVTDRNGFWLPKWQPARTWEVDAVSSSANGVIYSVSLAKSMAALRG